MGAATIRPTSSTPSEAGYLYHVTALDRAHDIAAVGLETHAPDWGTDQDVWPDGSTEKRSYWTARASAAWAFAPEGEPVLLRARAADIKAKAERGTGDYVVTKKIPAGFLQILTEDGWVNLAEWSPRENPATIDTIEELDDHITDPEHVIQDIEDQLDAGRTIKEITARLVLGVAADGTRVSHQAAEEWVRREIGKLPPASGGTIGGRANPVADFPPRLRPYITAIVDTQWWTQGGGRMTEAMRRFFNTKILPRRDIDRGFWSGEIYDHILAAARRDQALTAEDRALLDADVDRRLVADARATQRANPAAATPTKAIRMFRLFHTRDYRGDGDFHPSLKIPTTVRCMGDALKTDYSSDKLNPTDGDDEGWIDYTHSHDGGVKVYKPAAGAGGDTNVPAWIRDVDQLTWLGKCLGITFRDQEDGNKVHELRGTDPLPELYASPSGKVLFVIQGKRSLLAIIWGGKLAIERRGIVH